MLKVVYDLPFIETTEANLQLKNKPLHELLITWFLTCVDEIVKKGIRRDYLRISAQEKFLKGSLQVHKQLNKPAHKQHLFHIEYDEFSANRAENRLLHSALVQVLRWSKDSQNQQKSRHFLTFFDNVPLSLNFKEDFNSWSTARDMAYYQAVLPWLRLILNQQSPYTLKDINKGISFLIPMEKLFEKYVAKILKSNLPKGYKLTVQSPKRYLTENAFQMRPDIVISEQGKDGKPVCILDTKWKLIDEDKKYDNGGKDAKKGVSQADAYQLFAYGKKYKVNEVCLIYPQWEGFKTPFQFKFEGNLTLGVIPFDLERKETEFFPPFLSCFQNSLPVTT